MLSVMVPWLLLLSVGAVFGTGTHVQAWGPWLVQLGLLRAVRGPRLLRSAGVATLALWPGIAVAVWGLLPAPAAVQGLFAGVVALSHVAPVVLHRWLPGGGLLRYPALLVGLQVLGQLTQPFGTWGDLAYTQAPFLPLVQLVAVGGLPLVGFVVGLAVTAVDALLEHPDRRAVPLRALVAVAGFVALGAARLAASPAPARVVRVTLLDAPRSPAFTAAVDTLWRSGAPTDLDAVLAPAAATNDALVDATRRAFADGARLVVWPEGAAFVAEADRDAFVGRLAHVAGDGLVAATLSTVLPQGQADGKRLENTLVVLTGDGPVATYPKAVVVPGAEAELTRTGPGPLPPVATPIGRLGLGICFDLDFPGHVPAADLLVAPAEDWPALDPLHGRMAAFRAIETGTPLVRATRFARSTVVDAWGRTLDVADLADGPRTVDVPVGGVPTLAAHLGALPRLVALVGAALSVLRAFPRSSR